MTAKTLALLSLALLLLPTALASQPMPARVWTVHTTVEGTVQNGYATVKVIADIANRGPDPEFPFRVKIPDDAFVTGLTIERDGTVYEAKIAPREEARQTYEDQKHAQQTGGLVEKSRRSSLYSYLINVAEFTNVRATLTYERALAADRGVYALPLEAPVSGFGQDTGADFRVTILDAAGVSAAWATPEGDVTRIGNSYAITRSVAPRENDAGTLLDVSYTLPPTDEAGSLLTTVRDGVGLFVHRFRAPPDERHMPVDLVLVLDVSGSMQGLKATQMQDAAKQVLQKLRPEDRLHLAFFSSDASSSWPGLRAMTPENRSEAAKAIDAALIAGGTNLDDALRTGYRALDGVDWKQEENRLPALVLLTDGQPTAGETDRARLREIAKTANGHHANAFAIAFGSDADWSFLHQLAADADGLALRVPEGAGAEVDIGRFMETLASPLLKDVKIAYDAGAAPYRPSAPILFTGSELLVVGTYDASQTLHATITARAPDGERTYAATGTDAGSGAAWLPRLVGYHQIRHYQDLIDAEGARDDWVANLTALALAHGFVTDQTSLVVTLDARQTPTPPTSCNDCWTVQHDASAPSSAGSTLAVYDTSGTTSATAPFAARSDPAPTTTSAAPPHAAPEARVPAPAAALAVLAIAGLAAGTRARRR